MSRSDLIESARSYGESLGPVDWEGFTQSAQYANQVLPELRRMASYNDPMDVGTYTEAPDEEARWLFDELVDAFMDGVTPDRGARATYEYTTTPADHFDPGQ